jgi:hypothetical protein
MRSRTRAFLATIAGLIMVAAPLFTAGGAQAATSPGGTPPALAAGQCEKFNLALNVNLKFAEFGGDGTLNFNGSPAAAQDFCQRLIPGSSTLVTIFTDSGQQDCLAFNATTNTFYNHNPTGCGTGTQYLVWRFISLQNIGFRVYALQNQYDLSGRPCVVATPGAATIGNCANAGTDVDQQLLYEPF